MRKHITRTMYLITFTCVLVTGLVTAFLMHQEVKEGQRNNTRRQAYVVASMLNATDKEQAGLLKQLATEESLTLIDNNGFVLYDTEELPSILENYKERPEVAGSFVSGYGESQRDSRTLQQTTYYYAILLENGNIIRVGTTIKSGLKAIVDSVMWMILLIAILWLVIGVISKRLINKIMEPIYEIDFDNPMKSNVSEEVVPLLRKMEQQNEMMNKTIAGIQKQKQETQLFLEKMQEGIIALDTKGRIVTINSSAIVLLNAWKEDYTNKNILMLSRNLDLHDSVTKAINGEVLDNVLAIEKRNIQLHCSPVIENEKVVGVICLLLDVTEKEKNAQIRREFSATVSHELKTPLTSISGYAEIMKNGLVKPEDIPRFSGKIYEEAVTLMYLIEDILKLSQLDEGGSSLVKESVDLFPLIEQIIDRLEPIAKQNKVVLTFSGISVIVSGSFQLLNEVFYNLCDNAIKYSPNGRVEVLLTKEENNAVIKIIDTGVGISEEHQERVFERFYRVDSSHSKQTGGTGLGLSIVKNGVKFHNGKVLLESQLEKGTTMTVTLPVE